LLFFYILSNFIDSESGVTISNQFRITKLGTRRHRPRDDSTCHSVMEVYLVGFEGNESVKDQNELRVIV